MLIAGVALLACQPRDSSAASISAIEAWDRVESGQLTLIDIRRPEEWRETGVARHALRIDLRHPGGRQGFVEAVTAAVHGDRTAPVALICRTGNRTGRMHAVLIEAGFTEVMHVGEGMLGSRAGPGWIRQGLPIESCAACSID